MSDADLWEITRKQWRVAARDYCCIFCVHGGIIRGIWSVTGEASDDDIEPERRGFVGVPADPEIWGRFYGGLVTHYFRQGAQNPITLLRVGGP